MKIKFTKSEIKNITKLAESFVFAGVKEDVILNMDSLCKAVDLYRELLLKEKRYGGQPGKITINVPDGNLFAIMISVYGFRMVKESELDMATIGELCDIYKQLKSGSDEQLDLEENSSGDEMNNLEGTDEDENKSDVAGYPSDEDVADIGEIMPQPENETEGAEEADTGLPDTGQTKEIDDFELSEEDKDFFAQLAEDDLFR